MITISLCMIVKNEEKNLASCLKSLQTIVDEMIIVDTGSVDNTKSIARNFGAKIYDFEWVNDFAAARNFAFSKAGCDYIYSADADEIIDNENIKKFLNLKSALSIYNEETFSQKYNTNYPIDIVQMNYCQKFTDDNRSVYNYEKELRPKLFRRVRTFLWTDPIHEQVLTNPIVFDSDIDIIHNAHDSHAKRDLDNFAMAINAGFIFSSRLIDFYAKELYMAGDISDFEKAYDFFANITESENSSIEDIQKASIILVKYARLKNDLKLLLKFALKDCSIDISCECCCELGDIYVDMGDYSEASLWYYNAAFEQKAILDIRTCSTRPLDGLVLCYEKMGNNELAQNYKNMSIDAHKKFK